MRGTWREYAVINVSVAAAIVLGLILGPLTLLILFVVAAAFVGVRLRRERSVRYIRHRIGGHA